MANWVSNIIICKENLLSSILNEDNEVDFSILVPEPTSKEECIREYGEEYIDNGDKPLQHDGDKDWFNWYDWNCAFWGCKWNASETIITKTDDYAYVEFDTPWTPPEPWIKKLAKLGKPFIFYWIEERGFGRSNGYNGHTTINDSWDIPGEDADIMDAHTLHKKEIEKFFGDDK